MSDDTPKHSKDRLPNYRWIQFQISYLDDVDFMSLSDEAVCVYVMAYLLAGRGDAEGLLANNARAFTMKDIAWHLRRPEKQVSAVFDELMQAGFVAKDADGFRVVRFLEEQGPGEEAKRAQWREYQRSHREKLKQEETSDKTSDKTEIRQKQKGQADVNLTHDESAKPDPSLLSFSSFSLEGVLTEPAKAHFEAQAALHGDIKVMAYLRWCEKQAWPWGKAVGVDKRDGKVKDWEVTDAESEALRAEQAEHVDWGDWLRLEKQDGRYCEVWGNNAGEYIRYSWDANGRFQHEYYPDGREYHQQYLTLKDPWGEWEEGDVFVREERRFTPVGQEVMNEAWRKPDGFEYARVFFVDQEKEARVQEIKNA